MSGPTLITGSAGFIGSHLAEALLARGDQVVGVDDFDPTYDPALKERNLEGPRSRAGFHFERLDVRDADALQALLAARGIRRVAHLAARGGVRPSVEDPEIYADINVRGTQSVLQACLASGVEQVVFASSSSVYGARDGGTFHESDAADRPASPYAATKRSGELLCYAAFHDHGLPVTCLRFFTVYGPRQRPDMAIHRFLEQLEAGRPLTINGDGLQRRDFTYVDDIVAGFVAALERPDGYAIYNLGSGREVTVLELVAALQEAAGLEGRLEHGPAHASDVPHTRADIGLARRVLGWEPRVRLEEGLSRFVAWYRQRPG
ncbi:MAG: NAD-dependent epimerase/dehydratase family protein [Deltaproteobacteria bacterium]|nr:NAD-dependent epimerase/dehydratase family protein [Deltaproteobacteria bacterium]